MTWIPDNILDRLRNIPSEPLLDNTPYEIVRRLGSGGMGEVWLVQDTRLNREIALKVIRSDYGKESFYRRLEAEAKIVAQLEHSGIVPVYDLGVLPDEQVYYTMKYLHGINLREYILSSHSIQERLRLFLKISDAVAFAHSRGVIHRDLKPENIMVMEYGDIAVMDWGIATHIDTPDENGTETISDSISPLEKNEDATITHTGTPGYIPPEVYTNNESSVGRDVFALGIIFHELLTTKRPELHTVDNTVPPPSPRKVNPSIPKPLVSICLKAIANSPIERYQSVKQFSTDIERYLDGFPVSAHRESVVELLTRFSRKNKLIVLLLLAYLITRIILYFFIR